jgi:hypothetical protein
MLARFCQFDDLSSDDFVGRRTLSFDVERRTRHFERQSHETLYLGIELLAV